MRSWSWDRDSSEAGGVASRRTDRRGLDIDSDVLDVQERLLSNEVMVDIVGR